MSSARLAGDARIRPRGSRGSRGISVFAFVVTNPLYIAARAGRGARRPPVLPCRHVAGRTGRPAVRRVRDSCCWSSASLFVGACCPTPGRPSCSSLPSFETPRWLGRPRARRAGLGRGPRRRGRARACGSSSCSRRSASSTRTPTSRTAADGPGGFPRRRARRCRSPSRSSPGCCAPCATSGTRSGCAVSGGCADSRRRSPCPVLGMSLERALLLAESMDARGYGRGRRSRFVADVAVGRARRCCLAIAAWIAGGDAVATALAVAGAAAIAVGLPDGIGPSPTTRDCAGVPSRRSTSR